MFVLWNIDVVALLYKLGIFCIFKGLVIRLNFVFMLFLLCNVMTNGNTIQCFLWFTVTVFSFNAELMLILKLYILTLNYKCL